MSGHIGQISYANTKPFFYRWDQSVFPVVSGSPRELAQLARLGKIDAGALPLVECWALEKQFVPLQNWGIAVQNASHSVFVLSKTPLSELHNVTVGVTTESATSAALFELLIQKKYGHHVTIKRGFGEDDAAWLVIGDQALEYWGRENLGRWTHITDVATEWWQWTGLPCVFAKWVVRADMPEERRLKLEQMLRQSVEAGLQNLDDIAARHSKFSKIPAHKIAAYLKGFTYELGPRERAAEIKLKEMLYDAVRFN